MNCVMSFRCPDRLATKIPALMVGIVCEVGIQGNSGHRTQEKAFNFKWKYYPSPLIQHLHSFNKVSIILVIWFGEFPWFIASCMLVAAQVLPGFKDKFV